MVAFHRELTEKYKAFRHPKDPLFLSRRLQTVFNKFVRRGKKALARRHLYHALTQYRMVVRRPRMYNALLRSLRRLRISMMLVARRKGRKIIEVPVPVRRNKGDILSLQMLANAISSRREQALSNRIAQELTAITFNRKLSTLLRQQSAQRGRIYIERVNMEER
jgi:ribosomal protein S7